MDVALQNAIARRDSAAARITQMDQEIDSLRAARARAVAEAEATDVFIRTWYEMAGIPNPPSAEHSEANEPTTSANRRPKNPDREFVALKSLELIETADRPLARREIFDGLAAQDIEIKGKDPEMVLSTMLWRSQDKIVRLPNHGYWPTEKQYAPAAYYPLLDEFIGSVKAKEPEGGEEADDAE